ncbi:unnamed protein product [Periconia digitata]|uniref:GTP-binding protein 8 n=1 Tax=Periconia digitata TaxID=1303443 RepID=A0A9W4XMR8_9PLEO|nr:unnamed protein product [Periconia digitata]
MTWRPSKIPYNSRNRLANVHRRPRPLQISSSSFVQLNQARSFNIPLEDPTERKPSPDIEDKRSDRIAFTQLPARVTVKNKVLTPRESKRFYSQSVRKNNKISSRYYKTITYVRDRGAGAQALTLERKGEGTNQQGKKPTTKQSKIGRRKGFKINYDLGADDTSNMHNSSPIRRVLTQSQNFRIRQVLTTAPRGPAYSTMIKADTTAGHSWYWETLAPTFAQKAQANLYFTQQASPKILTSVAQFRHFPESNVPEVAFVGRSNVGKSSLLNTLVNTKLLARTSATPGFTKTMNLYGIAPKNNIMLSKSPTGHEKITGAGALTIVDMPGYGEGSLTEWGTEIMKYLQNRKQLRRVFVLIDAMHGIKEKDQSLLSSLRVGGIPHQVILSKLDRIYVPAGKTMKNRDGRSIKKKGTLQSLELAMADFREQIQPHGVGALGELLGVSSEVLIDGKGLGVDAVRFAVIRAAGLTLGAKGKVGVNLARYTVVDDSKSP